MAINNHSRPGAPRIPIAQRPQAAPTQPTAGVMPGAEMIGGQPMKPPTSGHSTADFKRVPIAQRQPGGQAFIPRPQTGGGLRPKMPMPPQTGGGLQAPMGAQDMRHWLPQGSMQGFQSQNGLQGFGQGSQAPGGIEKGIPTPESMAQMNAMFEQKKLDPLNRTGQGMTAPGGFGKGIPKQGQQMLDKPLNMDLERKRMEEIMAKYGRPIGQ